VHARIGHAAGAQVDGGRDAGIEVEAIACTALIMLVSRLSVSSFLRSTSSMACASPSAGAFSSSVHQFGRSSPIR
jgi:hypothetical protein